jgi:adenine deaminase
MDRAHALGKTVEGHSAGARGPKLGAYAGLGVDSCHEPITADEAVERLRLGMHVFVREGSVRRDLEAVAAVRHRGVSLRRASLASDGVWPPDLVARGYMDAIVQKAIDLGIAPVTAFQMASLNPAEHFGLGRLTGGLAPGRSADLCVLPDLRTVRPEVVVARGRVVAREGRCLVDGPPRGTPRPGGLPAPRGGLRRPGPGDRHRR